jgi:hypothetical protein
MANVSKNVRAAKRTFENITEIQDIVNANAVLAVNTLVLGMTASDASEATRQAAAKEILKLHWLFAQAAQKLLEEESPPTDREKERTVAVGNGVVAEFRRFGAA